MHNCLYIQYEGQGEEDAPQMSEEAILDQLFMSCVTDNDTAPVEDIITKVRGVVSAENQVNCFVIVLPEANKVLNLILTIKKHYKN